MPNKRDRKNGDKAKKMTKSNKGAKGTKKGSKKY